MISPDAPQKKVTGITVFDINDCQARWADKWNLALLSTESFCGSYTMRFVQFVVQDKDYRDTKFHAECYASTATATAASQLGTAKLAGAQQSTGNRDITCSQLATPESDIRLVITLL